MSSKIIKIIAALVITLPILVYAQTGGTITRLDQWASTSTPQTSITQRVMNTPLRFTGLGSGGCLTADSNGIITAISCVAGATTTNYWYANGNNIYNANSGNIGIGTTSPYAKLSVTNTGTNPSFVVEDSTSPDTTPFVIDASGNVGIGTASPWSKLTANSTGGAQTYADGFFVGDGAAAGLSLWYSGAGQTTSYIDSRYDNANAAMQFRMRANGTPVNVMTLINGNVGIGTTSPSAKLSVNDGRVLSSGSSYTNSGFVIEDRAAGGGDWRMLHFSGGSFSLNYSGDDSSYSKFLVDTSGDVGIGTTTPWGKLSVTNTGTGPSFVVEDSTSPDTTPFVIDESGNVSIGTSDNGGWKLRIAHDSGTAGAAFFTNGYAALSGGLHVGGASNAGAGNLLVAGTVGIGTTTPNAILNVNTTLANNTPAFRISNSSTGPVWNGLVIDSDNASNANARNWFVGANSVVYGDFNIQTSNTKAGSTVTDGTSRIYIDASGKVGISTTTPWGKLSVTNTGTGPSFVVEDSTSPDTTPFIIDAGGNVGIGTIPVYGKVEISSPTLGTNALLALSVQNGTNNPRAVISHVTSATRQYVDFGGSYSSGSGFPDWIFSTGNVGIGTTTPNGILTLNIGTDSVDGLVLDKVSSVDRSARAFFVSGTNTHSIFNNAGNLQFYPDATVGVTSGSGLALNIGSAGNVGVATTSYAKFGITNTGTSPSFVVEDSTSPDTTPFIIDASGNVGIGTQTPNASYNLDILGTATSYVETRSTSANSTSGLVLRNDTRTWSVENYGGNATTDDLRIYDQTAGLNRFNIVGSTGNIGIGSTSPTAKLSVGGSSYLGGAVYATSTVTFTGLTGATGGTNQDVCIDASGVLINETTGTCIVSSERFKNNIVPLKIDGLSNILKLKPVEYSYNEDDVSDYKDRQYGFTAEAVAEVDPHFAKYGTDGLPRTLDDRAMLAASIKAIQELKAEVDSLKAEVKLLKNNKK